MTVTKQYCDHCGKELNDMVDYTSTEIDLCSVYDTVDLCRECYKQLSQIVLDFCGKSGVE